MVVVWDLTDELKSYVVLMNWRALSQIHNLNTSIYNITSLLFKVITVCNPEIHKQVSSCNFYHLVKDTCYIHGAKTTKNQIPMVRFVYLTTRPFFKNLYDPFLTEWPEILKMHKHLKSAL